MVANFGSVTKDKKHTGKTITGNVSKNISFVMPYNIESPKISLTYFGDIVNKNYVTIVLGGRTYYYYIIEKIIDKHDLILQLELDYLHTFKNEILASTAHITRSNNGNKFIRDGLATQLEKPLYSYKSLGSVFTSGLTYIMIKGK